MARTKQRKQPYLLGICLIALCALQTSAYDLNLPAGYSFIGNNLSRPPNDLNTILGPSAGIIPAGSEVFKWQNGSNYTAPYLYSIYNGTTWSTNLSFAPGEAVFLRVSSPVSLTFTGVAATLNLPVNTGSSSPWKDTRFFAYSDQHPPGGTSVWSTITGKAAQGGVCMSLWTGTNFFEYDYAAYSGPWSGPDGVNGPPVPTGGAIFIGCAGVPVPPSLQTAYVLNLPAGYNFIGNNLSRPPNDLNTILGPSAGIIPAGSEVFKWQNGSNYTAPYLYSIYNGTTWSTNLSFAPGEAVFLRVSSPVSLTFTGVAATLNLPVDIGYKTDDKIYAYSDQHPLNGKSDWFTITGTSPEQNYRAVSLWFGTNFCEFDCDEIDSTWSPCFFVPDPMNGPTVPAHGAMFIQNNGARGLVSIPPSLNIALTPTNTVVQWPHALGGFILQQHTNPGTTTNWIASTNVIHDNGTYQFITADPPVESRYYRLFKP